MFDFLFNRRDAVTANEVNRFQEAQQRRVEQFRQAWKAYSGDNPKPLRIRQGDFNDNVCLSLPRLTVDKGVSALFGEETCFEVEDGVTNEGDGADREEVRSPEQLALDAVWEANRKMTLLQGVGVNGGVYGHTFLRVVPRKEKPARLINLCPEQMDIITDPEDIDRHLAYVQTWSGVDATTGKAVSYRDTHKANYLKSDDAPLSWTILREVQFENDIWKPRQAPETWPYAWSQIQQCQNYLCPNDVWGMSDIEADILSISNAINFAASNINRILRFHAHPKLVAKGVQGSDIIMSIDGITCLPSNDSDLYKIDELQSLEDAIQFYKLLKDAYDEHTRIPAIAAGKVEDIGQAQSGTALRILYGPLVEKTSVKRLTYGDMLRELCQHLLELAGFDPLMQIEVKWGNPMPADEKGEAEIAVLHSQLGVSSHTLLEKLGYDADKEMAKKGEEDDVQMNREAELMQSRFDKGQV